jgi:hypothetical protein
MVAQSKDEPNTVSLLPPLPRRCIFIFWQKSDPTLSRQCGNGWAVYVRFTGASSLKKKLKKSEGPGRLLSPPICKIQESHHGTKARNDSTQISSNDLLRDFGVG